MRILLYQLNLTVHLVFQLKVGFIKECRDAQLKDPQQVSLVDLVPRWIVGRADEDQLRFWIYSLEYCLHVPIEVGSHGNLNRDSTSHTDAGFVHGECGDWDDDFIARGDKCMHYKVDYIR